MSSADKKSIIDKIFGFYVINEMRDLLKEESKGIRENIIRINGEIEALSKTITRTQAEMDSLSEKIKETSNDEIKLLDDKIAKFSSLASLHKGKMEEFAKSEQEVINQTRNLYRIITGTNESIRTIEQKIKLYEKDKCPTCTADLSGAFHLSLIHI